MPNNAILALFYVLSENSMAFSPPEHLATLIPFVYLNGGGPNRVRVRGGVVVLRHAPPRYLAVVPVQLAQRVVGLGHADGGDVAAETDQGAWNYGKCQKCLDCP